MAYYQNIELDWTTWKAVEVKLAGTTYYLKNDLQYVPFVIDETNTILYYTNVNRDPSASGPYATLASGAKAHAVIQDITYTANLLGTTGNSISIQYTNDAIAVGQEFVTVVGNAITVHIVSGHSTAQQVLTAAIAWSAYNGLINHSQAAAQLVSAIVSGASGHAQTTQGPTSLSGGVASETVLADWTTNFLGSSTVVASFANGIGEDVSA